MEKLYTRFDTDIKEPLNSTPSREQEKNHDFFFCRTIRRRTFKYTRFFHGETFRHTKMRENRSRTTCSMRITIRTILVRFFVLFFSLYTLLANHFSLVFFFAFSSFQLFPPSPSLILSLRRTCVLCAQLWCLAHQLVHLLNGDVCDTRCTGYFSKHVA